MARKKSGKLRTAGSTVTRQGTLDGLGRSWIVFDDRVFGDLLLHWITETGGKDVDECLDRMGLHAALSAADTMELVIGTKAPSKTLTNVLCGIVPDAICNWRVLRNRAHLAAARSERIDIAASNVRRIRQGAIEEFSLASQMLRADNTLSSTFVEWLSETIDDIASSMGHAADGTRSLANIAAYLGMSLEELKGQQPLLSSDVELKATELASLLQLEGKKFNEAVSRACDAWRSTCAPDTHTALSRALLFLRRYHGLTQVDLEKQLRIPGNSIRWIEEEKILIPGTLLQKLDAAFSFSSAEREAFSHMAEQHNLEMERRMQSHFVQFLDRFPVSGLTVESLVVAAHKQPSLFYQQPSTVIGNIEQVVRRFAGDGLTIEEYLRAALRQPQLFCHRSDTIVKNICQVSKHFADDGLTMKDYLRAALKQPSLFYQQPNTVIGNIEHVVRRFADDGLTTKDYLRAALRQPTLFYQRPATIIGHIEQIIELYRKEFFLINASNSVCIGRTRAACDTEPVFELLVRSPALLCLSSDNLLLRGIYASIEGSSSSLLSMPRSRIESIVQKRLGHSDATQPVGKVTPPEGLYDEQGFPTGTNIDGTAISRSDRITMISGYARNLLLRALIREGILNATLEGTTHRRER